MVADVTHGDEGARGGVYYEAGFAHGLGLDVIFTCDKEHFDDVHFDIKHRNHILWNADDLEGFKISLKNRIEAVIGRGLMTFPEERNGELDHN